MILVRPNDYNGRNGIERTITQTSRPLNPITSVVIPRFLRLKENPMQRIHTLARACPFLSMLSVAILLAASPAPTPPNQFGG